MVRSFSLIVGVRVHMHMAYKIYCRVRTSIYVRQDIDQIFAKIQLPLSIVLSSET